jgi:hypothetical protein
VNTGAELGQAAVESGWAGMERVDRQGEVYQESFADSEISRTGSLLES